MSGTQLALLLQLVVMQHQDIHAYTFPYLGETFPGHVSWDVAKEANPVSKVLEDAGLHITLLPLAIGADLLAVEVLSDLDEQHFSDLPIKSVDIFLALAILGEIWAINTWARHGWGPPEQNWTLLIIEL